MAIAPLLLFAIIAGLTLFAWQNWTPAIALTILGGQTPMLPLSLWVVLAIVAGIVTTVMINALFLTANYLAIRESRVRRPSVGNRVQAEEPSSTRSRNWVTDPEPEFTSRRDYQAARSSAARPPTPSSASKRYETPTSSADYRWSNPSDLDDWERPMRDDWGDDESVSDRPRDSRDRSAGTNASSRPATEARQPQDNNSRRSDAVVDADYRVIVPPYRPIEPPEAPEESAEDWFEDDR